MALMLVAPWLARAQAVEPAPRPGAQAAASQPGAQEQRGFMWEARKDAQRLYLVGTIHVGRAEFHSVRPDILARFAESAAIAVEADLSDPQRVAPVMHRLAFYPPNDPGLDTRLAPPLRERVDKAAARYGLSAAQYGRMKPWLLGTTLIVLEAQRMGYNAAYSTEAFLFAYARRNNKPIIELEGVELQLRVFDSAPADVQLAYLEHAIASIETTATQRELRRVVAAWEKSDTAEMERIVASMHAATGIAEKFVAQNIVDSRHPAMVAGIERLAATGKPHVVALGSLHYFGPNGLLELLRRRGYTITPLP